MKGQAFAMFKSPCPWSPTDALESEAEALPAWGDRGMGEGAGAVVSRLAGARE